MKNLKIFFLLFISLISFSTTYGDCVFQQNTALVQTLQAKQLRLIVLCNFQGTNNALDIVTSSRSPWYELTPLGLSTLQAELPNLMSQNISTIYTAPAFRALQSTNLIGKALGLEPQQLLLDARLGMQNFGHAEGDNYTIYKQMFTSEEDMLESTPPGGETGCEVYTRTDQFLQSIAASAQNQTILIITHAFNFCHISRCLTGKFGNVPDPGKYEVYDFSNSASN